MRLDLSSLSAEQFLAILNSPFAEVSYAQEGEDLLLRSLTGEQRDGFYVDVGAHHPFRYSNTCIFHLNGWRGINIDATPGAMAPFHRHRPRDVNLEALVGCGQTPVVFDIYDEPALNNADPGRAAIIAGYGDYRVVNRVEMVPQRLDAILDRHRPPGVDIDFLTVDAEGMDLEVLRSNDFARHRPKLVLLEDHQFDFTAVPFSPAHRFLTEQGYELTAKLPRSVCWRDASAL